MIFFVIESSDDEDDRKRFKCGETNGYADTSGELHSTVALEGQILTLFTALRMLIFNLKKLLQ